MKYSYMIFLSLFAFSIKAQTTTIIGQYLESDNSYLFGESIIYKNKVRTTTDSNGKFIFTIYSTSNKIKLTIGNSKDEQIHIINIPISKDTINLEKINRRPLILDDRCAFVVGRKNGKGENKFLTYIYQKKCYRKNRREDSKNCFQGCYIYNNKKYTWHNNKLNLNISIN